MAKIYAMSDIHGCFHELDQTLKQINLTKEGRIVFVGDYVSVGSQSFQVLNRIRSLQKEHPNQVTVLLGNHDQNFLNWLFKTADFVGSHVQTPDNMAFNTIKSFFTTGEIRDIKNDFEVNPRHLGDSLRESLLTNDRLTSMVKWLRSLLKNRLYFETEDQIFVHAGIDEEAEDFWALGIMDYVFTGKYPATPGPFYKDIISGHIHSDEVSGNPADFGKVYHDGESHYFIDGNTPESHVLPLLVFDTETKTYTY